MRTGLLLILFAAQAYAATDTRDLAEREHRKARAAMAVAQQTSNPIRLLMRALEIKGALDEASRLDRDNVQVRLDLVRFHMVAPRMIGGGTKAAREEAAEIAKRDAAHGAFARGYIAYRESEYGTARRELREAAKSAAAKPLAMRWLGWLSQETQQYEEAFAIFEELRDAYELGRTAVFCNCRLERAREALLATPKSAQVHFQLALVHEKLGDRAAAKRAAEAAWKLDQSLVGLKEARERLR